MASRKARKACTILLAGPDPPPEKIGGCRTLWIPLLYPKIIKGASKVFLHIIDYYDTLIFTSPRAPRYLALDANSNGIISLVRRKIKDKMVWAVGPKTAKGVAVNLQVDPQIPAEFNTSSLALAVKNTGANSVLAVRRPGGSPIMSFILAESNIIYTEIHVYTVLEDPDWSNKVPLSRVDYIIASSSHIAEAIARLPRETLPPVLSIGKPTTSKLLSLGIVPVCTSRISTLDGVASCLENNQYF